MKWVPPTVATAVTANRYTLLSEAVVAGETVATGLRWDPFALTGYATVAGGAPGDGSTSFEVTPTPVDFGWGLFQYSGTGVTENLSGFAAGRLNFAVKSDSYPGKIEIGISTDTEDRDGQEAFLQIGPGDYGYCNTNEWCQVSIPVSAFLAANPKLDLRLVNFRFIIADRFSFTGKPLNTTGPANGDGTPGDPATDRAAEVEILEEIIANHRLRGASQAEIEATASFQKLKTLKTA